MDSTLNPVVSSFIKRTDFIQRAKQVLTFSKPIGKDRLGILLKALDNYKDYAETQPEVSFEFIAANPVINALKIDKEFNRYGGHFHGKYPYMTFPNRDSVTTIASFLRVSYDIAAVLAFSQMHVEQLRSNLSVTSDMVLFGDVRYTRTKEAELLRIEMLYERIKFLKENGPQAFADWYKSEVNALVKNSYVTKCYHPSFPRSNQESSESAISRRRSAIVREDSIDPMHDTVMNAASMNALFDSGTYQRPTPYESYRALTLSEETPPPPPAPCPAPSYSSSSSYSSSNSSDDSCSRSSYSSSSSYDSSSSSYDSGSSSSSSSSYD